MQKAPLFARDNPRASESDITRMTCGSRTEGTPYHRHIHHTVEGDHRQEGLHSGRENTSRVPPIDAGRAQQLFGRNRNGD